MIKIIKLNILLWDCRISNNDTVIQVLKGLLLKNGEIESQEKPITLC